MGIRERIGAWMRPRTVGASAPPASTRAAPEPIARGTFLAGKTALITGGARNIGRSIALEMAAQGATVLFTDVDAGSTASPLDS